MNLNCMGCSQCRRTEDPTSKLSSRHNVVGSSPSFSMWLGKMERTWSGNLGQRAAAGEKVMRKSSKFRSQDGHAGSALAVAVDCISTPRLVRCCGMKRDWSFQDPRKAVGGWHKFRRF